LTDHINLFTVSQNHPNCLYIDRLPTIAELLISPYPTIAKQFLGFKKLSFLGATSGFNTGRKAVVRGDKT